MKNYKEYFNTVDTVYFCENCGIAYGGFINLDRNIDLNNVDATVICYRCGSKVIKCYSGYNKLKKKYKKLPAEIEKEDIVEILMDIRF